MPIDPSISLKASPVDITGAAKLFVQQRQAREQAKRQEGLLQIQQQKAQREQQEFDRKSTLRDAAIKAQSLLPMLDENPQEALDFIDSETLRGGKVGASWAEVGKAYRRDPSQARSMIEGAIGRAQAEELIPAGPKLSTPARKDFTRESVRKFERSGKQSDLVPVIAAKKGLDKLLSVNDMAKLVGPKGEKPELGMTMREARDADFKVQKKISKQAEGQLKNVRSVLSRLEELTDVVFTAEEGVKSRVWDDVKKAWNRLGQTNEEQALYEAFSKGTVASIVRAAGERGNASNQDVQRALGLVPQTGEGLTQLPDTREVAVGKVKQLTEWINDMMGRGQGKSLEDALTSEEQAELEELRKRFPK